MDITATIKFKSVKFIFDKEISGIKNNMVQVVSKEDDEILENCLNYIKYINILCISRIYKDVKVSFTRKIKDITRIEQDNIIFYIFTWEI